MRNPGSVRVILVAAMAFVSVGCATVPMAPADLDKQAKRFEAAPDSAWIYIIRDSAIGGAGAVFQVTVDSRVIGRLARKTYVVARVDPGEHIVGVFSDENQEQLTVQTEPARDYFFTIHSRYGMWSPRSTIEALEEDEGKKVVSGAHLARGRACQ